MMSHHGRTKTIVRYFGCAFIILLIVFNMLIFIPPYRKDMAEIKVKKGTSLSTVAQELYSARVIPSSRVFILYMRILGMDRTIKAGTYSFSPKVSPFIVAQKMIRGESETQKVIIPEGRTSGQIAQILEAQNIVSQDAFLQVVNDASVAKDLGIPASSCEGYLFPDTYFFEQTSDPKDIVEQMVTNFWTTVKKIEKTHSDTISPDKLYERIILASIVEREYRLPEDAPLIASVFLNRLKKNMPLQSCATVVYVLTEHLGRPHPSIVYYNDLKVPDAYNTYIHRGLPPGPISNPGEISIRAALFPPNTEFLYFKLKDVSSGKHRFSHTLEEHDEETIIPKGL